jgi:hypothetical protein
MGKQRTHGEIEEVLSRLVGQRLEGQPFSRDDFDSGFLEGRIAAIRWILDPSLELTSHYTFGDAVREERYTEHIAEESLDDLEADEENN